MSATYHPTVDEYFPHTRRGHGSTHPESRVNKSGATVRNACVCINPACADLRARREGEAKRSDPHRNKAQNIDDWRTDHGIPKGTLLDDLFKGLGFVRVTVW
jgi:hypothetical protein